jgi:hypothetical protein
MQHTDGKFYKIALCECSNLYGLDKGRGFGIELLPTTGITYISNEHIWFWTADERNEYIKTISA